MLFINFVDTQLVWLNTCVRQQCNVPGSLDGGGDFPLMSGTVAGYPSGNNLSPFRNKVFQLFWIPVIDLQA
jgi:hypothetical protein